MQLSIRISAELDLVGMLLLGELAMKMRDAGDLSRGLAQKIATSIRDSVSGPRATVDACTWTIPAMSDRWFEMRWFASLARSMTFEPRGVMSVNSMLAMDVLPAATLSLPIQMAM